jgi:hypothetical protein
MFLSVVGRPTPKLCGLRLTMQQLRPSLSELERITAFLRDCGAEEFPHAHKRTLYGHLLGTRNILARWSQSVSLQIAGLLHSIYSTDKYQRQLIEFSRRSEVQEFAGIEAERLAYLFCVTSRADLWNQLAQNEVISETGLAIKRHAATEEPGEHITREEVRSLIVLHMANTAEQAAVPSGAPGRWLARASWLGSRLMQFEGPLPPVFSDCSGLVSDIEEENTRDAYGRGLESLLRNPWQAASHFAVAIAACPYVAEPMIWRAYTCLHCADAAEAQHLIDRARETLTEWGAPWDKRLELREWIKFLDHIDQAARNASDQSLLSMMRPTTREILQAVKAMVASDKEILTSETLPGWRLDGRQQRPFPAH